jgi:hypothetical protein
VVLSLRWRDDVGDGCTELPIDFLQCGDAAERLLHVRVHSVHCINKLP